MTDRASIIYISVEGVTDEASDGSMDGTPIEGAMVEGLDDGFIVER